MVGTIAVSPVSPHRLPPPNPDSMLLTDKNCASFTIAAHTMAGSPVTVEVLSSKVHSKWSWRFPQPLMWRVLGLQDAYNVRRWESLTPLPFMIFLDLTPVFLKVFIAPGSHLLLLFILSLKSLFLPLGAPRCCSICVVQVSCIGGGVGVTLPSALLFLLCTSHSLPVLEEILHLCDFLECLIKIRWLENLRQHFLKESLNNHYRWK